MIILNLIERSILYLKTRKDFAHRLKYTDKERAPPRPLSCVHRSLRLASIFIILE